MTVAELIDALLDADPAAEVTAGGAAVVAALVPCRPRELRSDGMRQMPGAAIFPAAGRAVELVVGGPATASAATAHPPPDASGPRH